MENNYRVFFIIQHLLFLFFSRSHCSCSHFHALDFNLNDTLFITNLFIYHQFIFILFFFLINKILFFCSSFSLLPPHNRKKTFIQNINFKINNKVCSINNSKLIISTSVNYFKIDFLNKKIKNVYKQRSIVRGKKNNRQLKVLKKKNPRTNNSNWVKKKKHCLTI